MPQARAVAAAASSMCGVASMTSSTRVAMHDSCALFLAFIYQRAVPSSDKLVIMYGPLFIQDREKITNLNYIYNNNNLEVVNMLRM